MLLALALLLSGVPDIPRFSVDTVRFVRSEPTIQAVPQPPPKSVLEVLDKPFLIAAIADMALSLADAELTVRRCNWAARHGRQFKESFWPVTLCERENLYPTVIGTSLGVSLSAYSFKEQRGPARYFWPVPFGVSIGWRTYAVVSFVKEAN